MNQGTLGERYLEASILPKVHNINKELTQGVGIGNDFAKISGVISTTGTGKTPTEAFYKCYSNFLCSCGDVLGMQLVLNLPKNTKDSYIKKYMDIFSELSLKYAVQILGGHTEIGSSESPLFTVCIVGKESSFSFERKKISEGNHIVMVNCAGGFGTKQIIDKYREKLSKRFDGMYLENVIIDKEVFSGYEAISTLTCSDRLIDNVYYIHDASFGGIYAALWQLGKWVGKGFVIDNRKIPIKQETIEVCEFFDINPYCIDSTGCFLLVCKNGFGLVSEFRDKNIAASVIGQITERSERIVKLSESDFRTLSPVSEDEMIDIKA